jgi:hypothetical protein
MTALSLVTALFTAIDSHQAAADTVHVMYNTREAALKAIRDAGYTSVQDGRTKKAAKKGEVPNDAALASYFNNRFMAMVKTRHVLAVERAAELKAEALPFVEPSKEQISANLKQQIAALNYYLKTGAFTTNAGREAAKQEAAETARIIHNAERKVEAEAKAAELAKAKLEQLAKQEAEAAERKQAAAAEAKAKAEAEAEAKAKAAAELEAAKAKPLTAAQKKIIAKLEAAAAELAKAEAEALALEAAEAKAAAELVKEVQAAAMDKVKADKAAAEAEAEAKRLKAEAEAKAAAKAKAKAKDSEKDAKQVLENIYKTCINNLTEAQIEELINKLTLFIDLN